MLLLGTVFYVKIRLNYNISIEYRTKFRYRSVSNKTWYQTSTNYITLHYITLHYITLHYITLHYITLHYITLHYITTCRVIIIVSLHCNSSCYYYCIITGSMVDQRIVSCLTSQIRAEWIEFLRQQAKLGPTRRISVKPQSLQVCF